MRDRLLHVDRRRRLRVPLMPALVETRLFRAVLLSVSLLFSATACTTTKAHHRVHHAPRPVETETPSLAPGPFTCADKKPLTVHFFDVAQALAALVELPDGQTVLVDLGDSPSRPQCGPRCASAHDHLVPALEGVLHGRPLSLAWITHQHSDHLGGASGVFQRVHVLHLVDNGTDPGARQVQALHEAAGRGGAAVDVVDPQHTKVPLAVAPPLTLTAVVPSEWPTTCERDKNNCSIGLRIDYCSSSLLFTGDAEAVEEERLPLAPVTLIQVGHHGSHTSSSATFIEKTRPKYAVISSGKPGEGTNATYCHPRLATVERVSTALGPPTPGSTLRVFDESTGCKGAPESAWKDLPVNEHLFSTARDGDVTLVTTGDGVFRRVP